MKGYSSLHVYDELMRLEEKDSKKLLDGLQWTITHIPSATLIGTLALIHFIFNRTLTPAIEFMVDDIEVVKSILVEHGLEYSESVDRIGVTVDHFGIDFIDSQKGIGPLNQLILEDYSSVAINGLDVKIVRPELLCMLMLERASDQDLIDAFLLLNSIMMFRFRYERYLVQLKAHLDDFESMILCGDLIKME